MMRGLLGSALLSSILLMATASPAGRAPIAQGNVAVTEKTLKGEVDDIQWVSANRKTVFILTDMNHLYRSTDEGKTWTSQMDKLKEAIPKKMYMAADRKEATSVKKIIVSAADPNVVILVGQKSGLWVTPDAGRSYIFSDVPEPLIGVKEDAGSKGGSSIEVETVLVPFHDVIPHPTEAKQLLASAMSFKCHHTHWVGHCFKQLFVSEDMGRTWEGPILTYVVQFDWAHNLGNEQAKKGDLPVQAIFATHFTNKKGAQRFGFWDADINFVVSSTKFKGKDGTKVLVEHGNRFLFTAKFLFIAQVNPKRQTEVVLQITKDGTKTFTLANMPYKIKQHSYTILDTSEGQVFLHVNHEGDGAKWGNVYQSDGLGLNYSLSLPHNRRDAHGKCDFEKVEGLEGIYLANFIDNVDAMTPGTGDDNDDDDDDDLAESTSSNRKTGRRGKPAVRTVITFDKGGVWG